jgi:hypothetical protein
MSDLVQWGVVAVAVVVSVIFLAYKFRRGASGECDGCCEKCKLDPDLITHCTEKNKASEETNSSSS